MDPLVGRTFAGYRIETLIGRGGMSRVYRAEQVALQRNVAIKILSVDLAGDPEYRERFLRECRLAASIEHPNILPIYDAGESDGLLYIAMRLVNGTDLRAALQRDGAMTIARALAVLRQAASALDAAHAVGLVHRDVKPANLLVAAEHLYLTDFGVAKLGEGPSQFTRVGLFVGTIDYAAPEQIRNQPVDGRTDIYALGCVFYECLTGRTPFDHPTEHAVMEAQLADAPPPVRLSRADLPLSVDAVIATAMAKDKESRYRTGALFAEAARLALEGRGAQAARPTVIEPIAFQASAPSALSVAGSVKGPQAPPAAPAARKPTTVGQRVLLAATVTVFVIGVIAYPAIVQAGGLVALISGASRPTQVAQTAAPTSATVTPPTTPPTTAPPPFRGRPVSLQAQDVIMPPGEFPFRGYSISRDAAIDSGLSWNRQFSSSNLDYYYISITVTVYGPSINAAAQLARATCDITFPSFKPTVSEVTADVIADGAKACQYHFEGNTADWVQYKTATRNVIVSVAGEPRLFSTTNAAAMNQMVTLARQQIAIIDRVAPR